MGRVLSTVFLKVADIIYEIYYEKFEENEPTPQVYYIEDDNNDKKDL